MNIPARKKLNQLTRENYNTGTAKIDQMYMMFAAFVLEFKRTK
jgi:hypothetical protein